MNDDGRLFEQSLECLRRPGCHRGRQRSQGGVEFPTGGICRLKSRKSPRAPVVPFFGTGLQGQQIWCDARADGHSPDERDRETHRTRGGVAVPWAFAPEARLRSPWLCSRAP